MPKFKKGDAVTFNRKRLIESNFTFQPISVLSRDAMLSGLTDGKTYIIPNYFSTDDVGISITLDNGATVFCHQDFFDAVAYKKVFNIGDTVVFTTPDAGGHEQKDFWANRCCKIGEDYKIQNVSNIGIFVTRKDFHGLWVNPNQFTFKQEYDMQKQEKQNLKPFSLERALSGDPVVTRDGEKVSQLMQFDYAKCQLEYPLVGAIEGMNKIYTWTNNGTFLKGDMNNAKDLFMAPTEKSGFIKIYPTERIEGIKATTSCIYDNEADALNFDLLGATSGIVVPIKWTE